jgi:PAS domain S-box-containing protein
MQKLHNQNTLPAESLSIQLQHSQEELRKSNEELNLVFNSIDEVLWVIDLVSFKVLQMSAACEKMYGYKPEEFFNNINLWKEVIHPDDKRLIEQNDGKLAQGQVVVNRYRIIHKDGGIRSVEAKIIPTINAEGALIGVRGITRDITKEKEANKALLESEFLFRQFFENAHEAILVMSVETGKITDYNKNALELFGLSGTEMLHKIPGTLSPEYQPDGNLSAELAQGFIKQAIDNGKAFFEWTGKRSDGKIIPCEVRLNRVSAFGKGYIRASILDITERKEAAEKINRQQKFYSSLIENLNDGIVLIGAAGEIKYYSSSACRISGFSLDEMLERSMFDFAHPDELEEMQTFFQFIGNQPGVPQTRQYRMLTKHGKYVWIEGTITNMLHDETIQGYIANYRNIDERKNAEAEIAALNEGLEQKVKARTSELIAANHELETFSYTVSHDLQAPLRATCGFAKIILNDYKEHLDDQGKEMLQIIYESTIRMSNLIRDLLAFSKLAKEVLVKKDINMNELVSVLIDEARFNAGTSSFKIVKKELIDAPCDLNLIRQVWLNLLANAIKYSGKKENPVIELGSMRIKDEVVYYVKDNGAGFDMKYAEKLFGVFKRLHHESDFEGTGVGLATVQRIVNRHGGRVWAEGKVDEGAVFYFTLTA